MWGAGYGSHFVGYLPISSCPRCSNARQWELYAQYSSEMFIGITEYTYSGVSAVCPICKNGHGVEFPPFGSRLAKWFGGKKTKEKWRTARLMLTDLRKGLNVEITRSYYKKLGYFEKRRYRQMLRQLEFTDFAIALEHA